MCREAGLKALTEDNKIETTAESDIIVKDIHLKQALQEVRVRGKKDGNKLSISK